MGLGKGIFIVIFRKRIRFAIHILIAVMDSGGPEKSALSSVMYR